MRAFADNEDLALLSGIDPDRVVRIIVITAVLATIAGTLYGLDKVISRWFICICFCQFLPLRLLVAWEIR